MNFFTFFSFLFRMEGYFSLFLTPPKYEMFNVGCFGVSFIMGNTISVIDNESGQPKDVSVL